MLRLCLIGVAGAAGALCRLGVNNAVGSRSVPVATLVVNVVGCFALGVVIIWGAKQWSPAVVSALGLGFLGAFTTFSTFAADAVALESDGQALVGAAYVVASVALGLGAAVAGQAVGRWLL